MASITKTPAELQVQTTLESTDLLLAWRPTAGPLKTVTAQNAIPFFSPPSLTSTYGAVDGSNDTIALQGANDSIANFIFVPEGRYSTTAAYTDLDANKVYYGNGQRVFNSYGQARNTSFLTQEISDPSTNRYQMFDSQFGTVLSTQQKTVGAAVGSTAISTYRNLLPTSLNVGWMETAGGKNTDAAAQNLGRTGQFLNWYGGYMGGQGDLSINFAYGEIYSHRAGATHFLANPAVQLYAGALGITSSAGAGGYLQPWEMVFSDGGYDAACVAVRSLVRTVNTAALGQVWIGDRIQSTGSVSADAAYAPAGLFRRGFDMTPVTLNSDKAAFVVKADDRLYFKGVSTADSQGVQWCATAVGNAWITYNSGTSNIEIANNGVVKFAVTPTGTAVNGFAVDASAWVSLTLVNSWVLYSTDFETPAYRIDAGGRVCLRGCVKGGSNFTVAATLPSGFRPTKKQCFVSGTELGLTAFQVWPTGEIVITSVQNTGSANICGLDGATFGD